jgi:ribonuclease HI
MARKQFYAVVRGHRPGIYDEWFGPEGAESQIKGFHQAVYKSFPSFTEAEE